MTIRVLALVPDRELATLRRSAEGAGVKVDGAASLGDLFARLRAESWSATVLSLSDDQVDEAVVTRVASTGSSGALLLSSPSASLSAALLAERTGALAVMAEPFEDDEVGLRIAEIVSEGAEVRLPALEQVRAAGPLLGESPVMGDVFRMIAKVAHSGSTVLITGESGTGKEVVARTLHDEGVRRDGPFVAINCAAIPEHLLESELFGHEKGAFTGAVGQRKGRFQRADGGTLFLDEIGDMSLILQAKVLRALEERAVERVGGEKLEAVDVRVVAATNQNLSDAIRDGRFREDLYYRLGVVEIDLPPLRTRGRDVRMLALHFAAHFADVHGRPLRAMTERALDRIERAEWPGNVRELRNVMDRAVLLCSGDVIRSSALRLGSAAPRASARGDADGPAGYPTSASLAEVEAEHIRRVLDSVGGQVGRAAEVLGIHRNTLTRKIQEYELGGQGA